MSAESRDDELVAELRIGLQVNDRNLGEYSGLKWFAHMRAGNRLNELDEFARELLRGTEAEFVRACAAGHHGSLYAALVARFGCFDETLEEEAFTSEDYEIGFLQGVMRGFSL